MEKSYPTSYNFLLSVFIDHYLSLFNISREIGIPRILRLSTKHIGLPMN